jgi:WhiB family redox-sensing transcriptional regulator
MTAPDWKRQDDALCKGESLVLFFGVSGERQPERDVRERKAKAICAQCPVRAACLEYALSQPERFGTWGGLNEDERAAGRRRRMRRASSAGISAAPEQVVEPEKHCTGCDTWLPETVFARDLTKRDGLHAWCRACANKERQRGKQAVA